MAKDALTITHTSSTVRGLKSPRSRNALPTRRPSFNPRFANLSALSAALLNFQCSLSLIVSHPDSVISPLSVIQTCSSLRFRYSCTLQSNSTDELSYHLAKSRLYGVLYWSSKQAHFSPASNLDTTTHKPKLFGSIHDGCCMMRADDRCHDCLRLVCSSRIRSTVVSASSYGQQYHQKHSQKDNLCSKCFCNLCYERRNLVHDFGISTWDSATINPSFGGAYVHECLLLR